MPMKSSPQSQNMFIWNVNRQRLQGRPIDLLFVLMVKKKKELWRFSQERVGFPGSHRCIIIWWVSGWPAFSFGRFTEVDLELAKFYSVSRGEVSVFSPKVRCGSKKFCTWEQLRFWSWYSVTTKPHLPFLTLGRQLSKQWAGYLFTFHRRSFQTPLGQRFSTGAILPPRGHLAMPGAAPSPSVWGGSDGDAPGTRWGPPRMLSIPSWSHWQYCWGWETLLQLSHSSTWALLK